MAILEVIKYEGDNNTLVWKHPIEDFNTMSQLIVHQSQEAIFFRNGQALDLFGAGHYTLETQNIPLIRKVVNLPTGGTSPFHCEVYFINKAIPLNLKWGTTSQFDILDYQFKVPLHVGASGALGLQIADSRKCLTKLVGTDSALSTDKLVGYYRDLMSTRVKSYLARIMTEISYLAITPYLNDISEALKAQLHTDMAEYGVRLESFYLSTIQVPEDDKTKIKQILEKELEYGRLGYNWADEQIADIAKKYAANEGAQNSLGGMAAQLPVAFAFGNMLRNKTEPLLGHIADGFSLQPKVFGSSSSMPDKPSVFGTAPAPLKIKSDVPVTEDVTNEFCPNCGKKIDGDAAFCSGCGKPVSKTELCLNCGRSLKSDENFCPKCGTKKGEVK